MHTCGNYRNAVANVDANDCSCTCICTIIARDLSLMASRLYTMAITPPGLRAAVTIIWSTIDGIKDITHIYNTN